MSINSEITLIVMKYYDRYRPYASTAKSNPYPKISERYDHIHYNRLQKKVKILNSIVFFCKNVIFCFRGVHVVTHIHKFSVGPGIAWDSEPEWPAYPLTYHPRLPSVASVSFSPASICRYCPKHLYLKRIQRVSGDVHEKGKPESAKYVKIVLKIFQFTSILFYFLYRNGGIIWLKLYHLLVK